jgi:hypothetical protein
MDYLITRDDGSQAIAHFGIKGQKHGIRRYQNEDGSLTAEGKERYGEQRGWEARQMYKRGTITKQEYKDRKRTTVGKLDLLVGTGNGRRSREFQRRHEKGFKAISTAFGALSGATAAAAAASSSGSSGKTAIAAILGGAAGAGIGYGSQALSNKVNRRMLDAYNNNKSRG